MITEKSFILGHSSFWHELLPTMRQYITIANGACTNFLPPYTDDAEGANRGLVNELAFRIFVEALSRGTTVRRIDAESVNTLQGAALLLMKQMRHLSREGPMPLDEEGNREAVDLAERMEIWLSSRRYTRVAKQPKFRGCGWLDTCHGDLLLDLELIEFKAGNRAVRSLDIRQTLVYCALNFASKDIDIESIAIVNPRSGREFAAPIEDICRGGSGRSAGEVLARIVDYISTPMAGFLRE